VHPSSFYTSAFTTRDPYPEAEDGIRVHAEARQIDMPDGVAVRVSERFFQPGMPADQAVWIGRSVLILRASVVYDNARGDFELTPETGASDDRVLVYLDVSAGAADRVVYETKPFSQVARGTVSTFPYLISEEVALAAVEPGETITAIRSARRWLFWGERQTSETLSYRVDDQTGKQLHLQVDAA
jgi:hypothetical protein